MIVAYAHPTRWGTFWIKLRPNLRWDVLFVDERYGEESLGSYASAMQAHDDLIGDHCFSNCRGLDTSKIGLPRDLTDWLRWVART